MKKIVFFLATIFVSSFVFSQSTFEYDVVLTPKVVPGLPGLHSYAFAQHNGKWLIIGGRKDGVQAAAPADRVTCGKARGGLYPSRGGGSRPADCAI